MKIMTKLYGPAEYSSGWTEISTNAEIGLDTECEVLYIKVVDSHGDEKKFGIDSKDVRRIFNFFMEQ